MSERFTEPALWNLTMVSAVASTLAPIWDRAQPIFERTSLSVVVIIAVLGALILRSIVHRLRLAYGSTLRDIPGPWHAKFTGAALKWQEVKGNRFYWVNEMHKKYGSIVRIAPEVVAAADPGSVKKIHGLGTDFRKRQQPGTAFNIFSMSEPRSHRARQRFYVNAFSNDNIKASHGPVVKQLCRIFTEGLREDAAKSPTRSGDLYKWCMMFGYDVAWQVVFDDAVENGLMKRRRGVDEVMMGCHLQLQNAWMNFCFPLFLTARFLTPIFPRLGKTFKVEGQYADLWQETERQAKIAPRTTFVRNTKFSEEDGVYTVDGGLKMSKYDITRDITTFLGAGGEPIGATLVYLIYTVLKDPELQKKLETEAAALSEPLTDGAVAEQCPLLDGTIYEALRLFGGGLTVLPRYSPTPQVLGGYTIPPGTEVSSHNHQLHRNPEVWKNPEKFDPERWCVPGQSKALTSDTFQPFSSGARACIAIHLVMTELRLFTAQFFREFPGLKLGPSVSDKSMRILDRFHIAPVSKSLEVIVPEPKE